MFQHCTNLTEIELPPNIKSIGSGLFSYCSKLKNVNIPTGVTSIGQCAYQNCSSLSVIDIPNGVKSIGASAFSGCSGIQSIEIPTGVTTIDTRTFYGCSGMKHISISTAAINSIGDNYTFYGCTNIESVEITASSTVTALSDRTSETYVYTPWNKSKDTVTSINFPDNLTSIGSYMFYGCSALTQLVIPDGVTSVGTYAFYDCTALTAVTIPKSVTLINEYAFDTDRAITTVNYSGNIVEWNDFASSGIKPHNDPLLSAEIIADGTIDNSLIRVSGYNSSYTYKAAAHKPSVVVYYNGSRILNQSTECTVSYGNNTNVAEGGTITVTGKGTFEGFTKTVTFDITPKSGNDSDITVEPVNDAVYTSKAITPDLYITFE